MNSNWHRWTIITALVLSALIFVSPWLLPEADTAPASWNFHLTGAVALLLGIIALMRADDLPEYGLLAVAVWMIISPWVLNLPDLTNKQVIFFGVILGGLAWVGRPSYTPPEREAS
jgi:hypothetical protein